MRKCSYFLVLAINVDCFMLCLSLNVTQAVGSHHEQPRGGRTELTEEEEAKLNSRK